MPRPKYSYDIILRFLEENKGLHSSKEIEKATGISYGAVARAVRQLTLQKRIKRRNGPAHSYLYEFVTHELPIPKGKLNMPSLGSPPVDPLNSEYIRGAIELWVSQGWHPRSTEAAQQLLVVLGQLHQFYWLELTEGIPVDQSDLDHLRVKLKNARDIAANFLLFFDRLLVTEELWNSKSSTTFMVDGLEEPVTYIEIARRVSEALK
jgi:hypothetical protein